MRVTSSLTLAIALLTPALLFADDRTSTDNEQEIGADKRAALEQYLELTQAERFFMTGVSAGVEAGMSTEGNPLLAQIPQEKIDAFKEGVGDLIRENLDWDDVKEDYILLYDGKYTLEELDALNEVLDSESMQMYFTRSAESVSADHGIRTKYLLSIQEEIAGLMFRTMFQQ